MTTDNQTIAVMLARWNPDWGKPVMVYRTSQHYERQSDTWPMVSIRSGLLGLGTRAHSTTIPRILASDVQDQVRDLLDLLNKPAQFVL